MGQIFFDLDGIGKKRWIRVNYVNQKIIIRPVITVVINK